MRNEVIEAAGPDGIRIRLEFVWSNDRFAQILSTVDSHGVVLPVLKSVEGLPGADWPDSPPFQSVAIEELPDGRTAALLVGMAGGSHWSASVETVKETAALRFDVACRVHGVARNLGNRFTWIATKDDGGVSAATDSSWAEIRGAAGAVLIVPDQSLAKLSDATKELVGVVPLVQSKPGTPTIRWKFDMIARQ